ncbi:MAG: hypothetical protein KGQ36_04550 [Rickettsiales bacterium]|nr:hypothetical protein [Rickettsiales bacterium]
MRTNIDQSFNQEEFKQGLKNWVSQAQAGERREEAARRILECKNKNRLALTLDGLD